MRNIDITIEPWLTAARYLAGLSIPEDSWDPRSPTRRAAKIILVENRLRRERDQCPIDYMALRKER